MNWCKNAIWLTACCCLLGSRPTLAQAGPPPLGLAVPADTTLLRRARLGAAFPFAAGVSMELGLYRRVRRQSLRADTLLAGMQQRLDSARAQLRSGQLRYENCQCARLDAEQADRQSQAALQRLHDDYQRLDKATARPWYAQLLRPLPLLTLLAGFAGGVYAGSR